jgi:predicted anti-sigma-YlaC factor YlaD
MSSEHGHLNPNRGWTLIRDSGQFLPEEVSHLDECAQCREWLSLFADLARGAGSKSEVELPFSSIAEDHHLTAGRAWALIRDRGQFTLPEIGHLHYCTVCNNWLSKFATMARKAGFEIAFEIPPCDSPRE